LFPRLSDLLLEGGVGTNPASLASQSLRSSGLLLLEDILLKHT
jgi:hypothetical protein